MKVCNHCHVKVAGDTKVCPLCKHSLRALMQEEDTPAISISQTDTFAEMSIASQKDKNMYPEIIYNMHIFQLIARAFLFFVIVVGVILVLINYLTYSGAAWSVISSGAIVYAILTLKYSIQNNTNVAAKILVQTLGAMGLVVLIDFVGGYSGWSVNYAIPGLFLVADASILVLMLVNFMNWQSYLLFQIGLMLFSIIPVVLYFQGVVTHPAMTFISFGTAFLLWVGTMVFGDRKAKNELMRRFHI